MIDWLVLDVNYMAWRAFFGVGRRDPGAAAATVLTDVSDLVSRFATPHVAFAFDVGPYHRAKDHPGYKAKRNDGDDDETKELKADLRRRVDALRTEVLPACGFGHVYGFKGFEADDVMASAVDHLNPGDRAVLVTEDKDVYQLLCGRCAVYHPRAERLATAKWFRQHYGLSPRLWAEVKAIVGCATDEVPGCPGIGEITALKLFRKELEGTKAFAKLLAFNRSPEYALAKRLVHVPYPGTPAVELDPEPDPWGNVGRLHAYLEKRGVGRGRSI